MRNGFSGSRAMIGMGWLCAGLLFGKTGVAQPSRSLSNLQLTWPSIAGCPTRYEVERAILHHLGGTTERSDPIAASVTIERVDGYRLLLFTRSQSGQSTRVLHADDCRNVTDAAVVILAMMLGNDGVDPGAVDAASVSRRGNGREDGAVVPPAVRSSLRLSLRQMSLQPARVRREYSTQVGLGAWAPFGIAKTPLLGILLSSDTNLSGWRLQAQIGWSPRTRIELPRNALRGVDVTVLSGMVSVGPTLAYGKWGFVPRIGLSECVLLGTGFGVDFPASRSAYFASGRIGELLELQLTSQFSVQSIVDLAVPFARPAMRLEPDGNVLRPARLGLDTALSLVARF